MSKSEQLRVGVIGGRRGSGHMAAIQASRGRMILAGVYDPLASESKDFLDIMGAAKNTGHLKLRSRTATSSSSPRHSNTMRPRQRTPCAPACMCSVRCRLR
jgi:hypothetical protein